MIVQFGGQTPLRIAAGLQEAGVPLLGTPVEAIDLAEDRGRFGALLDELGIQAPPYGVAPRPRRGARRGRPDRLPAARAPVVRARRARDGDLLLPEGPGAAIWSASKRRGGGRMYLLLLDRFLENAIELDVDALCDGEDVYVAGIMQHVEEAGVHSGDSACVLPPR